MANTGDAIAYLHLDAFYRYTILVNYFNGINGFFGYAVINFVSLSVFNVVNKVLRAGSGERVGAEADQ